MSDPSGELRISPARPPGLGLGLLAGGVVGLVLAGRTTRGPALVELGALFIAAAVLPLVVSRRTTVVRVGVLRTWGIRGAASARTVDLAQLSELRYVPGARGPARLRLRDAVGGRASVPLPTRGRERQELLQLVADAALRRGLDLDRVTRRHLGMQF